MLLVEEFLTATLCKVREWFEHNDFAPTPATLEAFEGITARSLTESLTWLEAEGFVFTPVEPGMLRCTARPQITTVGLDDPEERIFQFLRIRFPGRFVEM